MKQERLYFLVKQFRDKSIADEELAELKAYLEEAQSEELLDAVFLDLAAKDPLRSVPAPDESRMFDKIDFEINKRISARRNQRYSKVWYPSVAAAAVLLFASLLLWWQHAGDGASDRLSQQLVHETILPGNNKAKIVLDDGREVDLETLPDDTVLNMEGYALVKRKSGEISYRVSDNATFDKNRFNTIIVPKGGEYKLTLPDGSEVWLNAATSLKYPLNFGELNREVELSGEAYFSVTKQMIGTRKLPFTVRTGAQQLTVLGTEFNVNSYTSTIKTTLVEGAVQLALPNGKKQRLSPNQQSSFDPVMEKLHVREIDPYYTVAWKDGAFAFDNATVTEVTDCLSRWYDVTFDYKIDPEALRFTGSISRYENIEKLLGTIAMTNSIKFEIKGRRIMVTR